MTSHYYGKGFSELTGPRVVLQSYPTVEPLPLADATAPRRRRTIVCDKLSVNSEMWTPDDVRRRMKTELIGWAAVKADIRCSARPGVEIAADYAKDICLSSWSRDCPFTAHEQAPVPTLVTASLPRPEPLVLLYACNRCQELKPRSAYRAYRQKNGVSKRHPRCNVCVTIPTNRIVLAPAQVAAINADFDAGKVARQIMAAHGISQHTARRQRQAWMRARVDREAA